MKRSPTRTGKARDEPRIYAARTPAVVAPTPLLAVLALGTTLRAAFAWLYLRHPVGDIVPLDTEPYRALGRAIASGQWRDPGFDYLNPPYAVLLAAVAGLPPTTERLATIAVQMLLEAATLALVYYVASRTVSRRVVLLAAGAYALYGTAIFYTATILPVTLSTLALIAMVAAALYAESRSPRAELVCGAALGVLALIRPNAIVLVVVLVAWHVSVALRLRGEGRHAWPGVTRRLGFLAAGLTVVLLPWSLRAFAAGGRLSPFPVNGGINFYIGNSVDANGRYAHVANVADRPGEQVLSSIEEASRRAGRRLDAAETSAFWFREGRAWIASSPGAAFALTAKKAAMFFRAEEAALNITYEFAREHIRLLRFCLGFGVLTPLAAWGLLASILDIEVRRRPAFSLLIGVLAAYAASVIVFFISDRYRMPVIPLLAILAAHGTTALFDDLRARRSRAFAGLALVALVATGVNYPFDALRYQDDGTDHMKLSAVYNARGEYDKALDECQKASALAPGSPDAFFCFASAYYYEKDYFRAEMALRATLESQARAPSEVPARKNLVWLYKEQGLFDDALAVSDDEAERASILSARDDFRRQNADLPAYAAARIASGQEHLAAGRFAEARYDFKRAIAAAPTLPEAHAGLAKAARELQLSQEACGAVTRAAALRPQEAAYAHERAVLCP
jgi:tetratricopeptide (TPR) repeat protein